MIRCPLRPRVMLHACQVRLAPGTVSLAAAPPHSLCCRRGTMYVCVHVCAGPGAYCVERATRWGTRSFNSACSGVPPRGVTNSRRAAAARASSTPASVHGMGPARRVEVTTPASYMKSPAPVRRMSFRRRLGSSAAGSASTVSDAGLERLKHRLTTPVRGGDRNTTVAESYCGSVSSWHERVRAHSGRARRASFDSVGAGSAMSMSELAQGSSSDDVATTLFATNGPQRDARSEQPVQEDSNKDGS